MQALDSVTDALETSDQQELHAFEGFLAACQSAGCVRCPPVPCWCVQSGGIEAHILGAGVEVDWRTGVRDDYGPRGGDQGIWQAI